MAEVVEFLDREWVLKQVEKNPKPLNPLGEFVYYRTYSRWLDRQGRREYWHETVKRTIEYSMSLEYTHMKDIGLKPQVKRMKDEAKELFINMYNTKQLSSGRSLWLANGNQTINKKYRMGNFNCSYLNIEKWEDFNDVFYLLLVGSGVGFGGKKHYIEKLKPIRINTTLINEEYNEIPKEFRNEDERSYVEFKDNTAKIQVNDSKEAWVDALNQYFKLLTEQEYEHIDTIIMNYDNIRPKGLKLKTFGGTSSGPKPMMDLFEVVDKTLKNKIDPTLKPIEMDEKGYGRVRPIHVLDIGNMIANIVVSGGVRRSAEIFLFDADDYESMFAKYGINGLWTEEQLKQHKKVGKILDKYGIKKPEWFDEMNIGSGPSRKGVDHRRMSNNSIAFIEKPDKKFMDLVFEMMQLEGEPKHIWAR